MKDLNRRENKPYVTSNTGMDKLARAAALMGMLAGMGLIIAAAFMESREKIAIDHHLQKHQATVGTGKSNAPKKPYRLITPSPLRERSNPIDETIKAQILLKLLGFYNGPLNNNPQNALYDEARVAYEQKRGITADREPSHTLTGMESEWNLIWTYVQLQSQLSRGERRPGLTDTLALRLLLDMAGLTMEDYLWLESLRKRVPLLREIVELISTPADN